MRLSKLNAGIGAVALALFTLSVETPPADAATYNLNGYVCKVSTFYEYASHSASFYTGPACTGSYIGVMNIRSVVHGAEEGYYESTLAPLVTAAANDTRITGTYTVIGSPFGLYFLDDFQFNAN